MGWLKALIPFRNRFADARLPKDLPAEQLNQRQLVDMGYQIFYNEPMDAYPEVKCCSKRFVLLSDVYRDPVPLLRTLERRIRNSTEKVVLHNITDVIPSRFLLLPIAGDEKKKRQCRYLENEVYPAGWGIAGDLLKADQRELFIKPHASAVRADDANIMPRTMPRWEIADDGYTVIFHNWKITGADETAKQLADFIRRTEAQGRLLPPHLERLADLKMRPYAVAESISSPRATLITELHQAAEQAVVFSHYLFGKFVDEIQDVYHFHHPQEALSWRLYSWQLVCIARAQLLAEIRKRFPEYNFHPLLSATVLTAPEMEEKLSWVQQETVGAPVPENVAETADVSTVHYEPEGRPSITLVAQRPDADLERYKQVFEIRLQVNSLTAKEGRLEEADFPEAAHSIVTQIPDLKDTWSNEPAVEPVEPSVFWNQPTEQQYGGGQSERLAYALFCSVYNQTPQWLIDLYIDDLLTRMFMDPLRPEDWIIYKVNPEYSSYFHNDFLDYLWVVFHREGKHVRVLYGTDTD